MPRPPRISRADVLDAALAIADADGLDAVTMASVADRLDVTPMALYRHVDGGKEGLLDALVERVLAEVGPPPATGAWEARLVAMGQALREVARAHPAVFPLLLTRPVVTPAAVAVRDQVRDLVALAGIGPREVGRAERYVTTLALGLAVGEATGRFAAHSPAQRDQDMARLGVFVRAGLEALAATT